MTSFDVHSRTLLLNPLAAVLSAAALATAAGCASTDGAAAPQAAASAPAAHSNTDAAPPSNTAAARAKLTVVVEGLEANQGTVYLGVMENAQDWSTGTRVAGTKAKVTGSTMQIELDAPVGQLAIRLYQDENDNGRLDKNLLGIPTEGYAFSGKGASMGAPSFESAAFNLPAEGTTVTVKVQ